MSFRLSELNPIIAARGLATLDKATPEPRRALCQGVNCDSGLETLHLSGLHLKAL